MTKFNSVSINLKKGGVTKITQKIEEEEEKEVKKGRKDTWQKIRTSKNGAKTKQNSTV